MTSRVKNCNLKFKLTMLIYVNHDEETSNIMAGWKYTGNLREISFIQGHFVFEDGCYSRKHGICLGRN